LNKSQNHKIIFAGAGPGAPDLITLRCKKAIEEADLIIFAGSLVNPEILANAKKECKIIDRALISLGEIIKLMQKGHKAGGKVLRLHTGDPAVYGAIAEQMRELDKVKIPYEIIPGVSSVFASAAALKTELTAPGVSQTVILTRQAGRTPVPHGQEIANLARHGATMAIFLSAENIKSLTDDLLRGGYSPDTPACVVYKASWKDEKIIRGKISDIESKLDKAGFAGRHAMIIVGDVLSGKGGKSLLYDASFSHSYRGALKTAKAPVETELKPIFRGKTAIYAITGEGIKTAIKLNNGLKDSVLFVPARFKSTIKDKEIIFIKKNAFLDETISRNWNKYDGHIFIMAAGIVVRKIAPLIKNKTTDPAVVVCDQAGNYAISLLSGHIGGGNRLANFAARILGGQAVISTATDVQNLMAFDEMAAIEGWKVENPEMIKTLNSMLLEGKRIAVQIPKVFFLKYYSKKKNLVNVRHSDEIKEGLFQGCVVLDEKAGKIRIPALKLTSS
jgi:precorrin-4 C11-methyltransferase